MEGAQDPVLLSEPEPGIARITINRPDKRNALTLAAMRAVIDGFDTVRGSARAIILTGAGGTFCAGMDLKSSRPALRSRPR